MDPMGKWKTCPVPQYTPQILEIGSCLSAFGRDGQFFPFTFDDGCYFTLGLSKAH